MQLATDTALAAAVDSSSRVVVSKLEADWYRNGQYNHPLSDLTEWVTAIQVQRDIAGSLPEQTSIVEGFIAARLDFTLEGTRKDDNGKDAVDLLSPLRTDSPLYGDGRTGIPVRWRLGLQTASGTVPMLDQFTGTISSFNVNASPRQVVVSCLDGTDKLHSSINLPLYSLTDSTAAPTVHAKFRINSHWVLDYVLRQNGVYQSPPPQTGCIYSATGHGAMIPEVGHQFDFNDSIGEFNDTSVSTVPGKWGYAFNGGAQFSSGWDARANGAFSPVINRSYLFQAMVDYSQVPNRRPAIFNLFEIGSGRNLFGSGGITVAIDVLVTGQIVAKFYNGASLVTTINGPTFSSPIWTHVWVRIDFGATLANSIVSFPTMTVNPANLSGLASNPDIYANARVYTSAPFPVQNLQICDVTGLAGGVGLYDPVAWTPQCDLDIGLNEFASLPVIRGSDSLDVLKSVVGSEYGVAGFSESGRFFFKNRNTLRKNNLAIDKVYDADTNLGQLSVVEQPGAIRNSIVTKTKYTFDPGSYEVVFTLRNIHDIEVPPGSWTFRITLDTPCWLWDSGSFFYVASADWDLPWGVGSRFHTINAVDSSDVTSGVTVGVQTDPVALAAGRDEALLLVTNTTTSTVVFALLDGRPALEITGFVGIEDPEIVRTYERATSIARYGRQTFELEADPWRQNAAFMQPIALSLLKDLKAPIPLFNPITVVGDPRVQLADTALIKDPQGLGGPTQVGVYSLQRTLTEGKLVDVLVLRAYGAPGRWILGHQTQSVLGQTTILG